MRAQSLQSQEAEEEHAVGRLEPEPIIDGHLAQMEGQQQEQEEECDSDSDLEWEGARVARGTPRPPTHWLLLIVNL